MEPVVTITTIGRFPLVYNISREIKYWSGRGFTSRDKKHLLEFMADQTVKVRKLAEWSTGRGAYTKMRALPVGSIKVSESEYSDLYNNGILTKDELQALDKFFDEHPKCLFAITDDMSRAARIVKEATGKDID